MLFLCRKAFDFLLNLKLHSIYFCGMIICCNAQSATSGIYKAIGDKARSSPDQIFTDNKFMSKLATGHYAYTFVSSNKSNLIRTVPHDFWQ